MTVQRDASQSLPSDAVAIVGMAGKFPGAPDIGAFWRNQLDGRVTISHFSDEELDDSFDDATRSDPNFVKARSVLDDADKFDAAFFAMYAREAALTDPQHRVFLEVCWHALENGGCDPNAFDGSIGVFGGSSMPTYLMNNQFADRAAAANFASHYQVGEYDKLVGSLPDALCTRVAYKLNLRGPAMTLQTACSTSLLAVSQACQSLLLYQCDAALAGGVSITFPQRRGYLSLDGGLASRDGVVRPFDKDASGTVFGHGAAAVLLKRLEDAVADGDRVYAIIRGSGVNNDGAQKVSFTGPSAQGQADAIAQAYAVADVEPRTVGFVETHGTATPLGDPIEFAGLVDVFGQEGDCVLGSGKATVGHLDAAAGVTGLIRAAMALHSETIPPMVNFTAPNPRMDLEHSPFRIVADATAWPRSAQPRRAGVSSFGVGGTNVHVVLEETPSACIAPAKRDDDGRIHVLPMSAHSEPILVQAAHDLAEALERDSDLALAATANTLQHSRARFVHRATIAAQTRAEAIAALRDISSSQTAANDDQSAPPVVFMFPGQGAQYPGMGLPLYQHEPVFRDWIDRGAEILKSPLGLDLRDLLHSEPPADEDTPHPIRSTVYAQPALFLTQYALAQTWMSYGVTPSAMIGHSVGELVAASLADVIAFDDALQLVAARAELMQSAPAGAMVSVRADTETVTALTDGSGMDLAAVNAPNLCVVAGPFDAADAFEKRLDQAGVAHRRLHTSHAFHSSMMDPVVDALRERAAAFRYGPAQLRYVSCVTGDWAGADAGASGEYWARHCREPVRFQAALETVTAEGRPALLEVGPGRTLATFAAQGLDRKRYAGVVTSMPDFADRLNDRKMFAEAVGRLWTLGIEPDWAKLAPGARVVAALPNYPFARERHWIDAPPRSAVMPSVLTAPNLPLSGDQNMPANQSPASSAAPMDKPDQLIALIAGLLQELSGQEVSASDADATFLELGFDSLFLGQVAQRVKRDYAIDVTFRQLLSTYPTIRKLAEMMDEHVPADHPKLSVAAATGAAHAMPELSALAQLPPGASGDAMALFQQHQAAMQNLFAQQLRALQGGGTPTGPIGSAAPALEPFSIDGPEAAQRDRFRMFKKGGADADAVTPKQQAFLDDLCRSISKRMAKSKAYVAKHRRVLADPRTAAGFRPEWKEAVFPIVFDKAKGSRIWDVDGNEFVDLVNGYGQTFFGHNPNFVIKALRAQEDRGFPIGPQSNLTGEVAERLSRMVGMERVTFCNTGSEAVMAAMRVARTVTGREVIVVFANDYHGQFDEVLVKAQRYGVPPVAMPIAPGIPRSSLSNMVVLPYGAPESLDWIRRSMDHIAAVIVEPVQSRHPELQPVEFLKSLREMTSEGGAAMVMDEIVTGFRTHPAGAQHLFGVKGDMATYGKVLGGGMPIGVLAGDARFMDALDGGDWHYGDVSVPEVAPTFFAGTFVRHPLVLAAALAVLKKLEAEGPALQERLTQRTSALVDQLNGLFAERELSLKTKTFSSWFITDVSVEGPLAASLFVALRQLGVNLQDGFPCFLTTEHSEADCQHIVKSFGIALDMLEEGEIIRPGAARETLTHGGPTETTLSQPQQEIWLAAQMGDMASCAFNESVTLRLHGHIDHSALSEALNDVVARHDALRAHFSRTGEQMHVLPALSMDLPHHMFRGDSEKQLKSFIADDARTPFDLVNGPLVRAALLSLADDEHALIFSAHHIICDGWSMGIILKDLEHAYRQRKAGSASSFDTPAASFAAHAGTPIDNAQDMKFWRDQFQTIPDLPELPTDRLRPAHKAYAGASYTHHLSEDLYRSVKSAGSKLGASLFTTLFSAFQIMVGKLSNANDVVVGVPIAGQSMLDEPSLVGHAVNFLPIRCAFSTNDSLGAHLMRAQECVLDALEHQNVTYAELVRELGVKRPPNRQPLTEIQFNLEKAAVNDDFAGVGATLSNNAKAAVHFDAFFNVTETPAGLRIDVDYSTELFDEATIERWIGNYGQVLLAIVSNADQSIADLEILTTEERERLLVRGNARNTRERPVIQTTIGEFEDTARRHKLAPAVLWDDHSLNYEDLNAYADQVAAALQEFGVTRGECVGLLATRSAEAIVAILGVWKAGGAYVPLDPAYPESQLKFMAKDSGARIILAQDEALDLVPDSRTLADTVLKLSDIAGPSIDPAPPATSPAQPQDAAYVMYTSGSTGKPKGVVVPHRGIVRLVKDQAAFTIGADDVMLACAPLAFDLSTLEFWAPLLNGGCVAVVPQVKPTLLDITHAVAKHKATAAWFTAGLFNALVDEVVDGLAPLRLIITGGEAVSVDHARRAIAALPNTTIMNGYGPTENTTFTTTSVLSDGTWTEGSAPIGGALSRTTVFVCDEKAQLVPDGVAGELLTGGEGVALGYHNRPELTAERFTPDPFTDTGGVLYHTGDLVRWKGDKLEFLGRQDSQVKINGYRVELGEVEAVLSEHPEVIAARAFVDTGASGARRLAVAVKSSASESRLRDTLTDYMQTALAPHLQPKVLHVVEEIPLNTNGKFDPKKLPDPVQAAVLPKAPPAGPIEGAPSTPTEKKLAAIWQDVLGLSAINIDQHVLALGADSLQIFRLGVRFASEGIALEARHVLAHPTLRDLAAYFDGHKDGDAEMAAAPKLSDFRGRARRRQKASTR